MTKEYDIIILGDEKMKNPFNITFGELPQSLIDRKDDIETIKYTFNNSNPESKVYIITGPRGCGKTVLHTALIKEFEKEDYLTIDLNPFEDLNEQFAAKLYEAGKMKKLFLHQEFSFSFKGITFSVKGDVEITNISTLIDKMLDYLKKKHKRVLVTIDDVSSNEYVKSFVFSFQQMIRNGYDVFLLMTGLYENVSKLEKNKSLTFFLRAPKLNLESLDLYEIAYLYQKLLNLDEKNAVKYSKLTKGYAYGYQLLGSLLFKYGTKKDFLIEYDKKLIQNSYSLTWEKLTNKEREILTKLSQTTNQKELCELLKMSNGNLQTYKKRLIDKGLIVVKERGKIDFALPRFKQFVKIEQMFNEEDD